MDKKVGFFKSIKERDPAARSALEIFLFYPGVHALIWYRVAHFFYKIHLRFIATWLSMLCRFFTGIEIHPGAKIGKNLFIDHGHGVVVGETAVIGDNCTIYQNATLGGTGKEHNKRHPTLLDNVVVGVPDNCTVVGVGRVIRRDNDTSAANTVPEKCGEICQSCADGNCENCGSK